MASDSFLGEYDEVNTVTFGAGGKWWITVRRYLARGDFKKAQAALVTPMMSASEDAISTTGAVDSGGYQDELVIRAIVDWNLTDRQGNRLPLDPDDARRASVAQLPQSVYEDILVKIEGATARKAETKAKEAEIATFPGAGVEGPVGTDIGVESPETPDLVPA